jgi:hypothetical protein
MQKESLRRCAVWGPVVLLFGCADGALPLDPGPRDLGAAAADAGPTDSGPEDSGMAEDSGPPFVPTPPPWEQTLICERGGVQIPYAMRYADEGNECWCGTAATHPCRPFGNSACDDPPYEPPQCTASPCPMLCHSAAIAPEVPRTCTSTTPCAEGGYCRFAPGCGEPRGQCVYTQTFCRTEAVPFLPAQHPPWMMFCGCDGVTYWGDCPNVPYAHSGPCE